MNARGIIRSAGIVALVLAGAGCTFAVRGSDPAGGDTVGGATPPPVTTTIDLGGVADLSLRVDRATATADLSKLPAHVGDACNGQCDGGLTCMTWVPAGYCSRTCTGNQDCPNGSSCGDLGEAGHFCLVDSNGGNCARTDVRCIDCGAKVCGPSSFCDAC